jgi:ElaB/YqjD/DUF883 family membrane-anchored ribosome-binding protein
MTLQGNIRNSSERIAGDFQALLNDAEQLVRAVGGVSGEALQSARTRMQERVDALKRLVDDGRASAIGAARSAATTTDRYVHDSPWALIGAALAAGFVIGVLSRRGLDRAAAGLH